MTEHALARALRSIADERPPPPLPDDLWRRGRRRRRRRQVAAVLAAAAAVAALAVPLVALRPAPAPVEPAAPEPAVPRAVYQPMPFPREAQRAPVGPAAMIVTGVGVLSGGDVSGGYEGRTLVVGRDGRYRVVSGSADTPTGDLIHLSPDGRRLAVGGDVAAGPAVGFDQTSVVDLTTGEVRAVTAGAAAGWSPDGRLLVRDPDTNGLRLVDLDTGRVRALSGAATENDVVAFSADGGLLALQRGATLDLVDVATGRGFRQVDIGAGRRLAGPGAWTADGRIGLWELPEQCRAACTALDAETGEFTLTLLDPGTAGTAPARLDPVSGSVPRLLGWLADGTAVVQTHEPPRPGALSDEPPLTSDAAAIVGLVPDGGTRPLVALPGDTVRADIAGDLLRAGRFGGDPPGFLARIGEFAAGVAERLGPLAMAAAGVVVLVLAYRRLRRPSSRPPAS